VVNRCVEQLEVSGSECCHWQQPTSRWDVERSRKSSDQNSRPARQDEDSVDVEKLPDCEQRTDKKKRCGDNLSVRRFRLSDQVIPVKSEHRLVLCQAASFG